MSVAAASTRSDQTKDLLVSLLALTPLYFLLQSRSALGLDRLHVGLLQVVILLVFRFFASLNPSAILLGGRQQTEQVEEVVVNVDVVVPTKRGKKVKRVVVKPPSLYTPALLDTTLHNFLSITEPSHLPLLPSPVAANPPLKIPTSLPLSEWTSLMKTDTLAVLQHPSTKTLYAICATFPDVQLRQLFETLTQVGNRTKWDAMASGAEEIDQIEVGGRRGSVSWLAMKGVAVIKAKDMVLLSVAARLPQTDDSPLRLFCATTSFDHPNLPAKPEYNRMALGVSGFFADATEEGGSRVIQITDLSGLGSWVPSAVVRTVTQTMIPKSLIRLGRTAKEFNIATDSKFALEGDEWLPPILGTSDDSIIAALGAEEDEEEEESDDEDDESETSTAVDDTSSISKDLSSLLAQLRSLTGRLSTLESLTPNATPSNSAVSGVRKFITSATGIDQTSLREAGVYLTAVGGAVGAAIAVSLLAAWGRRKR